MHYPVRSRSLSARRRREIRVRGIRALAAFDTVAISLRASSRALPSLQTTLFRARVCSRTLNLRKTRQTSREAHYGGVYSLDHLLATRVVGRRSRVTDLPLGRRALS